MSDSPVQPVEEVSFDEIEESYLSQSAQLVQIS